MNLEREVSDTFLIQLLKLISFANFQTKAHYGLWIKLIFQECLKNYNILTSGSVKGGISIDQSER